MSESLDAQIAQLKAQKRTLVLQTKVEEKYAELVDRVSGGSSLEEVVPVMRALVNFLNEQNRALGNTGKRGRKPKHD